MTIGPKALFLMDYVDPMFPFDIALGVIESTYPIHRHDFLECAFVLDGQGTEIINGVEHKISFGTFTVILPYQVHELRADPRYPLQLYSCGFDIGILNGPMGHGIDGLVMNSHEDLPSSYHFEGDDAGQLEHIFHQMYAEHHSTRNKWRYAFIRAKLIEALILFDRARCLDFVLPEHPVSNKEEIWSIVQYVHSHFREDISLSSIATQFHLSPPYLSSLFKRHTGFTFIDFLHTTRIQYAANLLTSTDMNLTELAQEVGYNDYSTFSRTFHKKKGMGPSDFRKLRITPVQT